MGEIINSRDLGGLKITPLEGGSFFVSSRCAVCGERVSLRLSARDVEASSPVDKTCLSGSDWPGSFRLSARYSPGEIDESSGVDVWGEVFEGQGDG